MPPEPTQRILTVEQYLNGELPDDERVRVEQQMRDDPAFEQDVLAQWLIMSYLRDEKLTTDLYRFVNARSIALHQQKADYKPNPRAQTLIDILRLPARLDATDRRNRFQRLTPLLIAGVLVLLAVGSVGDWYVSRPVPAQVSSIPFTDNTGSGSGFGSSVRYVARYKRLPGWTGIFTNGEYYYWPKDTLYVYGERLYAEPIESWELEKTDPNAYTLLTSQSAYPVRKGQKDVSPLTPNETP